MTAVFRTKKYKMINKIRNEITKLIDTMIVEGEKSGYNSKEQDLIKFACKVVPKII